MKQLVNYFILLILLNFPAWAQEQITPSAYLQLGRLVINTSATQIRTSLGTPDSVSPYTISGVDGNYVQEWIYRREGLHLGLATDDTTVIPKLIRISADSLCTLKSSDGIGIGSKPAQIISLRHQQHPRQVDNRLWLGDAYFGTVFFLRDGKVIGIFIGQLAE